MSSLEELAVRLDNIEVCVKENNRALRGSNGDSGLVAAVALLVNDLTHLKEMTRLQQEKNVKWPQLLWRFGAPIAVALTTAGLTAWLITR